MNILVIDDEVSLRRTIRTALESMGHRVTEAGTSAEAVLRLSPVRPDLVLLDLRLGRESGLDVLGALLKASPGLGIVVVTAYAAVDTAVEAMRRGALDYLAKPFTPKQLAELIDRWCGRSMADGAEEAVLASAEPAVQRALHTAFAVAATDATVLLRGESGTGKGVLARASHARSRRGALRHDPLPEPLRRVAGERVVRPFFEGGVHGGRPHHRWPSRLGRRGHLVPRRNRRSAVAAPAEVAAVGSRTNLDAVELEHIRRVLAASPTLDDAARTLGMDASTLYRKRKKYGL